MPRPRRWYDNAFVGFLAREWCICWAKLKGVDFVARVTARRDGRIVLLGYRYMKDGVEMAFTVWCDDELFDELKGSGLFKPEDEQCSK